MTQNMKEHISELEKLRNKGTKLKNEKFKKSFQKYLRETQGQIHSTDKRMRGEKKEESF